LSLFIGRMSEIKTEKQKKDEFFKLSQISDAVMEHWQVANALDRMAILTADKAQKRLFKKAKQEILNEFYDFVVVRQAEYLSGLKEKQKMEEATSRQTELERKRALKASNKKEEDPLTLL
jgi:hypothetical protein